MKIRIASVVLMFGVVACAPVPEPETPPTSAPTKRSPPREPLPPAPSNMPEIVYASVTPGQAPDLSQAQKRW
jgi:hypothetical protein